MVGVWKEYMPEYIKINKLHAGERQSTEDEALFLGVERALQKGCTPAALRPYGASDLFCLVVTGFLIFFN